MDRARKNYSFWAKAGFVLFALVCLIVFIYMRFPYDMFKGRLERSLGAVLKKDVSLGHIQSDLLLGFKVDGMEIDGVLVATEVKLHPRLIGLIFGKLGLNVSANLLSGSIEGLVESPVHKLGDPLNVSMDIMEVDPGAFARLYPPGVHPKGIISGQIAFNSPPNSLTKLAGNASLVWREGSIPLVIQALPLDTLEFKTMELDAHMGKGVLTIDKAELSGDISGSIKGAIRIRDNLDRSRLNLTGEAALPQEMMSLFKVRKGTASQGLKFSLRGTIDRPRFRILTR